MKKTITESQLRNIVAESMKKVLKENTEPTSLLKDIEAIIRDYDNFTRGCKDAERVYEFADRMRDDLVDVLQCFEDETIIINPSDPFDSYSY